MAFAFPRDWRPQSAITEEHFGYIDEPTCKAYAQAIVAAPRMTVATEEKALMAVYPKASHISQDVRRALCARLATDPRVLSALAQLRDEQFRPQLMGKIERRAKMAAVVRTTLSDVMAPDGTLRKDLTVEQERAIKKVKTRTTTHGEETETTHEIELFDPLVAGRLDAELDGTLSRGGASTLVQVNVNNQESFEQKVQRLIGAEKTEAPAISVHTTLLDPLLE